MPIRRAILICWLFILTVTVAQADASRRCAVCDKLLPEGAKLYLLAATTPLIQYYIYTGAIRPDQIHEQKEADPAGRFPIGTFLYLGEECNAIKTTCSICGLPVADGSIQTGDGRTICRREAAEVVLDSEAGRQVFETATREARNVVGVDFGLKQPNVTVQVFDINDWTVVNENGAEVLHKIGHSKSRRVDEHHIAHYVGLYSGQRRSEVICTCVHEYMHLWLNENVTQHQIEQNTGEGICELLAYKVALARQDVYQQKRILENPYTQGRLKDLLEVEHQRGFDYILEWAKNGTTKTINETPVAVTNKPAASQVAVVRPIQPAPAAAPAPPASLMLKGMFSKRGQRIAILNDGVSVAKGETATLHLNGLQVTLKCLDVLPDAVLLQLEGATNIIKLEME